MPTSLTGAKKLAATAAWLAEPPSSRGFSRQGVLIESKAVEPTTRTLIISFQLIARFHRRPGMRNHRCLSIRNQYVLGTASVALSCTLSVSPEIVAAREDFFNHGWTRINKDEDRLSLIRVHPCSSVVGTYWLRLDRAALYRRFLTCQLSPASNVLPIINRRYGR